MADSNHPCQLNGVVYPLPDYTFYHSSNGSASTFFKLRSTASTFFKLRSTASTFFNPRSTACDLPLGGKSARALVCSCFKQQRLSVSVRFNESPATDKLYKLGTFPEDGPWRPSEDKGDNGEFAASVFEVCESLYPAVFNTSATHAHGVVVISGATAAAKSNLARGLCFKYLKDQYNKSGAGDRRPHLVTFEDPIEKMFADPPTGFDSVGVDYTPREKRLDAKDLRSALNDALRQSPTLFYVGEIRDDDDWRPVVDFAGTGHLLVTTSHAGSLSEAIGRILRAVEANSPAERGYVAQRILAVVHMTTLSIPKENGKTYKLAAPALWRRTPRGIAGLVNPGMSSILPYNWSLDDPQRDISCFGRRAVVETLCKSDKIYDDECQKFIHEAHLLDRHGE